MTDAALQKRLARMQADIDTLKERLKTNAAVEKARERLRAMLREGIESGPGKPMDAAYWKKLKTVAQRKKTAK